MADAWRFWIDRGGTFIDLVASSPSGERVVRKVLSRRPGNGEAASADPVVEALREVLGLAPGVGFAPGVIEEVRLGTTVATNAQQQHRAEPVLLLVNRGFADLPRIGDQHRPDIFALHIVRPRPLSVRVIEVEGRLAADGQERAPLRLDDALANRVKRAMADGYRSCAVALMHAIGSPATSGSWAPG